MSVLAAPDEALIGRLLADATLTTLAPGRVHLDFAPEGTPEPFVVVNLQIEQATLHQSETAFVVGRYQVKAVHRSPSATAAKAVADRIDALLNHATFAIVGMALMACHRVERFGYVERDANYFWQHRGADYELWAS
jgi:hypothetical protein